MTVRRPVGRVGRERRDAGAVALITALVTSLVLFGIVSLVLDLGLARDTHREAQGAADAAALAAANALYLNSTTPDFSQAVAAAKAYVQSNLGDPPSAGDWATCTDAGQLRFRPPGETRCISFDRVARPALVRVRVPVREVPTAFAGLWNISQVAVDAEAEATIRRCGVCVLGVGRHVLDGEVDVNDADVAVNGRLAGTGSVSVTGGDISLERSAPAGITFSPSPQTGQAPMADPLAALNLPDYSGLVAKLDPCTQGPGIYDGMDSTGPTCTLSPGLYVFTDNVVSSERSIVADGVTMYFTCRSGTVPAPCARDEDGARLRLTGTATLQLTAPTSGPTKGLALVADRENESNFSWRGDGSTAGSGTIYARSASLDYGGNGTGPAMNSLVVVGDYDIGRETDFGGRAPAASGYTTGANVVIPTSGIYLSK